MKLPHLVLATALGALPALAQNTSTSAQKSQSRSDQQADTSRSASLRESAKKTDSSDKSDEMTDARLAQKLHAENKAEIEAGKLGEQNGSSQAAKDCGRMLVDDHTKADQELLQAAKTAGLDASGQSALTRTDREEDNLDKRKLQQLRKMKGAEFDRTYGQTLAQDHHHLIELLEKDEGSVSNPGLKRLVTELIPQLKTHEEQARRLSSSSGGETAKKSEADKDESTPRNDTRRQNQGK